MSNGFRKFLCKIGIHKWTRPTFIDYGLSSNVLNWITKCKACSKVETWVEVKGLGLIYKPFNPIWRKRILLFVLIVVIIWLLYFR